MKVLIATSSFARAEDDPQAAAGKGVYELVTELGREIEGTVVTPLVLGAPASESIGGIRVQRISPVRPESSLANAVGGRQVLRVARLARAMRREVRRLAPSHDLVHAFWFFPAGWAVQSTDRPRMMTVPGGIETYPSHPFAGRIVTRAIRSMDLCVGLDASGEKALRNIGAARTAQIANSFRSEAFPIAPTGSQPRFVYVGRLAPEKGIDVLLEAMALLRNRRSDIHLDIVGDGPARAELGSLAAQLELSTTVSFKGALRPADVRRELARSRGLVLPSHREGLPAAALEALSTGRPVVASAVGGLPDLLSDDHGIVVEPNDPQALAVALKSALHRTWDPQRLHDRAAGFDVTHAAADYLSLYRSLIEKALIP